MLLLEEGKESVWEGDLLDLLKSELNGKRTGSSMGWKAQ